jgi:anti-sigma B factor antagonist
MGFQSKFHAFTTMTDGRITVFLEGDFDLSAASEFRAVVEPWMNRKDRVLVLNLRKLKYIDSSGIGFMVSVLKSRNEVGAELVVEEIPSKIKRLLDMTGVTPYLTQ